MKVTDIERIVVDIPFTPRQQEITTQSVSTCLLYTSPSPRD